MHVSLPSRAGIGSVLGAAVDRVAAVTDVLLTTMLPKVVEAVLDRLDLTAIVRERVRIDELVADVDVNAIAARLDIDAILDRVDIDGIVRRVDLDAVIARVDVDSVIARVDLIRLANEVVVGIDLPRLIRESSASMASEAVGGVRLRSLEADEAISRAITRWLPRRGRDHQLPLQAGADGVRPVDDRPGAPAND